MQRTTAAVQFRGPLRDRHPSPAPAPDCPSKKVAFGVPIFARRSISSLFCLFISLFFTPFIVDLYPDFPRLEQEPRLRCWSTWTCVMTGGISSGSMVNAKHCTKRHPTQTTTTTPPTEEADSCCFNKKWSGWYAGRVRHFPGGLAPMQPAYSQPPPALCLRLVLHWLFGDKSRPRVVGSSSCMLKASSVKYVIQDFNFHQERPALPFAGKGGLGNGFEWEPLQL